MRDEIKAGLIIIIGMAILTLSVIAIGGTKIFDSFDVYYVKLYNVTGLDSGSAVMLGGMKVGRVLSIMAPEKPNSPITIEIGIDKGTTLYEGTTATISQIGFVGDIFLQLYLNPTKGGKIPPKSTIPAIEQSNFNTIMAKAEELTVSLKRLVEDTNKVFTDENTKKISTILDNTNTIILNTDKRLELAIVSLQEMTTKLNSTLTKIESTIDDNRSDIRDIVVKLKKDLDAVEDLINSLKGVSNKIASTADSANHMIQNQNENLDSVLKQLVKTTDSLNDAIIEFKNRPWRLFYREVVGKEE
ncbi:MAG: MlaD family protein [Thermodesulfovibrionales bacterium]|nr:MlaD family protein [Thermodesulfovibrionales bacterium]